MSKHQIYFGLALLATAIVYFGSSSMRDESGQITEEGSLDVFSLRLGDCFNNTNTFIEGTEVSSVRAIPCSTPHDNEIYALHSVEATVFPSSEELSGIANDFCLSKFDQFIGIPYLDSLVDFTYLVPTEESWVQAGDREIQCIAYQMSREKYSGTLRNSSF